MSEQTEIQKYLMRYIGIRGLEGRLATIGVLDDFGKWLEDIKLTSKS